MIEPTTKCLDELEKSITAIKSRGYLHQQKISINEDSQRYLEQFRTTLSELSLKVR
ncbi:hypothetical protein SBDP2_330001 [Syntrophobacter sp. SbD2]|nr:hypothetical protein SBDP2_330001 [Syntrophobacter sp. SbD2]